MDTSATTSAESWWWCRRCKGYVDLLDPGDVWPKCAKCGCRKVEMRKPAPTPDKIVTSRQFAHAQFERMRLVVESCAEPKSQT